MQTPTSSGVVIDTVSDVRWSAVFAGAVAGQALPSCSTRSAARSDLPFPHRPDLARRLLRLAFLSGLYLILTALVSYGFGAYVASRLRTPMTLTDDLRELRDGYHGLVVLGRDDDRHRNPVADRGKWITAARRAYGVGQRAGGLCRRREHHRLHLDRLFRGARGPAANDMTMTRAEAARILLTTSSHRGMLADDRAYLVRLVEATTGLAPADAQARVNDVSARASRTSTARATAASSSPSWRRRRRSSARLRPGLRRWQAGASAMASNRCGPPRASKRARRSPPRAPEPA